MDPHRYIVLCSNEPAISEQIVVGSLDKSTGLLTFRAQECEALRAALHDYFIAGAIFDLNYSDESILDIIGQVQKSCIDQPLICISGRQLAGHTLSQPNRTLYYAHSQIPPFALRKMLLQPPVPEPMQFQGPLQVRSLAEIVQLLLFAGLSGRLMVWNELRRGDLWVHRAQIVHADAGGRQGHSAALSMLSWPSGTFRFQPGRAPTQTMQLGPHYPLFDKTRRSQTAEASGQSSGDSPSVLVDTPSRGVSIPVLDRGAYALPLAPESTLSQRSPSLPLALVPSVLSPAIVIEPAAAASPIRETSAASIKETSAASIKETSVTPVKETSAASIKETNVTPVKETSVTPVKETHVTSVKETLAESFESPTPKPSSKVSWQRMSATESPIETRQEEAMAVTANSVKEVLSKLELTVEGFIGAAVADSDSGMCVGSTGGAGIMNMEVAAAANTEVVRAKRKAMKTLNLRDEIEDILVTLGKHYHLIRPLRARPQLFIYVAVERSRANLAMARFALSDAERDLGV